MDNKKLIYSIAVGFSAVFCLVYYMVFINVNTTSVSTEKHYLYMNQVGLFKKEDGANSIVEKLKGQGINGYLLKKNEVTAVVCDLSLQEEETKKQQENLVNLGYSYIQKTIEISDNEILALLQQQDYAKALEMIQNESQGSDGE